MASKRRLQIKNATVKNLASQLGNAMARRVRLDIADLNPTSPLANRINQVVANRQHSVAKLMASYYTAMIDVVPFVLEEPPIPPFIFPRGKGGNNEGFPEARKVNFRDPQVLSTATGIPGMPSSETVYLEPGRERRIAWRPLGLAYASSREETRWAELPQSESMWRKTGALEASIRSWHGQRRPAVANPENYKVGKITKQTRLGKNVPYSPNRKISGYVGLPREGVFIPSSTKQLLATYIFAVQHPRLGHPVMDQLLRRSYISGKAQSYYPTQAVKITVKRGSKSYKQTRQVYTRGDRGLNRLILPEHERPMLARFAAAVGRREMAALRKLLKRG